MRVGIGWDVHPFDPNRALVLGGVRIDGTWGLRGHSDADGRFVQALPRAELRAAQTPQAARLALLRRAYEEAARRGLEATDEVALLLAAGFAVTAVPGDPDNVKITTPDDLALAEAILRRR